MPPAATSLRFPLLPALLLLAPTALRAQVAYVIVDVVRNEPVVSALGRLERTLAEKLTTQITHQQTQITRATTLNQSLGLWDKAVPSLTSGHLAADTLSRDHTAAARATVVFDQETAAQTRFQTAAGQALTVAAADLADYARLDQTGRQAQTALADLAAEIQATHREVAATYDAMTTPAGMTQQEYEKLRGKLQALQLHLQGLQAQQRDVFALLQGQATLTRNKLDRDAEIAAQIQKANHAENASALAELRLAPLSWR